MEILKYKNIIFDSSFYDEKHPFSMTLSLCDGQLWYSGIHILDADILLFLDNALYVDHREPYSIFEPEPLLLEYQL